MTVYAETFVELAESQRGDRYVYGAKEPASDPNPAGHGGPFDCSGLVSWCIRRAGGVIPDGSTAQFGYCRDHGTLIPIEQGVHTRGALLGIEESGEHHIVISRGDGTTIEARGSAWGVGEWNAEGRGWTWAGLVPGVSYTGSLLPPHPPGTGGVFVALTDQEQRDLYDMVKQVRDAIARDEPMEAQTHDAVARIEAEEGAEHAQPGPGETAPVQPANPA